MLPSLRLRDHNKTGSFIFLTKRSRSFLRPRHHRTTALTSSSPPPRHSSLSPSSKFAASLANSHSFLFFQQNPKTVRLGGLRKQIHWRSCLKSAEYHSEFKSVQRSLPVPPTPHPLVCILLRQLFSLWVPRGRKDDYKQSSFECS